MADEHRKSPAWWRTEVFIREVAFAADHCVKLEEKGTLQKFLAPPKEFVSKDVGSAQIADAKFREAGLVRLCQLAAWLEEVPPEYGAFVELASTNMSEAAVDDFRSTLFVTAINFAFELAPPEICDDPNAWLRHAVKLARVAAQDVA